MRSIFTASALGLGMLFPAVGHGADFYHETLDDGMEAIVIVGDIVDGDEESFREFSIQFPKAVVGLDSGGGQLVPALEIGRLIRLRGYDTVVLDGHTCASACALVWMGGGRKTLEQGARLGFHASYYDDQGRRVESGAANALIGRYLTQLNYSEETVLFATLASPDEIWWLDETTRDAAGIEYTLYQPEPEPVQSPPPIRTTAIPAPAPTLTPSMTLEAFLRSDGIATQAATSLGATGLLHAELTDHLTQLYANDAFMRRAESELRAARIDFQKNPSAAGAMLFRLSNKLILNGMSRLPQEDVNRFFGYFSHIVMSESPQCDVSLVDEGKPNLNEFIYVQRLGDDHLSQYMGLLRRAIIAESSVTSPPITLDQEQVSIAETAWAKCSWKLLRLRPGQWRILLQLQVGSITRTNRTKPIVAPRSS